MSHVHKRLKQQDQEDEKVSLDAELLEKHCLYYAAILGASLWASWITWMPFFHVSCVFFASLRISSVWSNSRPFSGKFVLLLTRVCFSQTKTVVAATKRKCFDVEIHDDHLTHICRTQYRHYDLYHRTCVSAFSFPRQPHPTR